MAKSSKAVEAAALVKSNLRRLERKLSKVLTEKEMRGLEETLGLIRQGYRMLAVEVLRLSPALVASAEQASPEPKQGKKTKKTDAAKLL